jgi:hypothetical protein
VDSVAFSSPQPLKTKELAKAKDTKVIPKNLIFILKTPKEQIYTMEDKEIQDLSTYFILKL